MCIKKMISLKKYDILVILVDFYMKFQRFFATFADPDPLHVSGAGSVE